MHEINLNAPRSKENQDQGQFQSIFPVIIALEELANQILMGTGRRRSTNHTSIRQPRSMQVRDETSFFFLFITFTGVQNVHWERTQRPRYTHPK